MNPDMAQIEQDYGDAHVPYPEWELREEDREAEPTIDALDPDHLTHANWHLRCIGQLKAKRERLVDTFSKEIDALNRRLTEACDRINRDIAWHEAPVIALERALLDMDPTLRTVELPHGELIITVPKAPRVTIDDPAALTVWAIDHQRADLYKTEAKPVHAAVKKAVLAGEIIPGASAEVPAPTFSYSARRTAV